MAHVQLLGTGGTIVSRGGADAGAVATDSVAGLVDELAGVTVSSRDVLTTNSFRLDLADLRAIAQAVRDAVADPGTDGVVITHGTDTMEETAFLLELVHTSPEPVVLTGAQRAADHPDTDGPRNVRHALLAAADPRLRDSGALIAFDGAIRGARGARKTHTLASNPFQGGVAVARVADDRLAVTGRPVRRAALPVPTAAFDDVRVEIVLAYPGATPVLFDAAVASGAHAVVLAGTGVGNAGPGFAEAVKTAVESGVAVVLSTRVPWGPVTPLYGNGGGTDLVAAGAVVSGDLNPFQARILTALLLSQGTAVADFPAAFAEHV